MEDIGLNQKSTLKFYLEGLFSLIDCGDNKGVELVSSAKEKMDVTEWDQQKKDLYKRVMNLFALSLEELGNVEITGHDHGIALCTRFIAEKLRQSEAFQNYINDRYIIDISYVSMLHDIGKWRIPRQIILKPSSLTQEEWKIVKNHPQFGIEMVEPFFDSNLRKQYIEFVKNVVLYHHERWDGQGYLSNLKGEDIPLSARIVSLADMYHALTSDRVYRESFTHEEAVNIIAGDPGKFDPVILRIFLENNLLLKKILRVFE